MQSLAPLDAGFNIAGPSIGGPANRPGQRGGNDLDSRDYKDSKVSGDDEKGGSRRAEPKRNAFGSEDFEKAGGSSSKDDRNADRKPSRRKADDDVQVMKF